MREEESTQHNITIVGGRNANSRKAKRVQRNLQIKTMEIGCFDAATVERFNEIQINGLSYHPIKKLRKGFLYIYLEYLVQNSDHKTLRYKINLQIWLKALYD